jgi:hypothetical protein
MVKYATLHNFHVTDHEGLDYVVTIHIITHAPGVVTLLVCDSDTGEELVLYFESEEMDAWLEYAYDHGLFKGLEV